MHDTPLMPPRFTLNVPPAQVELLEHLCRFDSPHHVHRAMFDACNAIEGQVKPEFFNEPFVQAAAFLFFAEFAWHRARSKNSKLQCAQQVRHLIDPFRKEFVIPW